MATEQIAWALTADRQVVIIYPEYQSAPYTGDDNLVDLTVSASQTVLLLELDEEVTKVQFSQEKFPMEWQAFEVGLDEHVSATKCDASPSGDLYLVLSTGQLAKLPLPKKGGKTIKAQVVEGVENVGKVSAAPDGLIWVVAYDSALGSVVKYSDPAQGEWHTIPNLNNANGVTGTANGNAFALTSAGHVYKISTDNDEKIIVSSDFDIAAISVGPENRLWVLSCHPGFNGSIVYYTDDNGLSWTEVKGSGAIAMDAGLISTEVGVVA